MIPTAIGFIRGLWSWPGTRLIVGLYALSTAFGAGFIREIGSGLEPLINRADLFVAASLFVASVTFTLYIGQLIITASRGFFMSGLNGVRDTLVGWWSPSRVLFYWLFWLRFKTRRLPLYDFVAWLLFIGLVVAAILSATDTDMQRVRETEHLDHVAWCVLACLAFSLIALIAYTVQHVRRHGMPDGSPRPPLGSSFLRSARAFGRLGLAGMIVSGLFGATALGASMVSFMKHLPPMATITLADGSEISATILMTTSDGVIFFQQGRQLASFVATSNMARVDALN